LSSDSASEWSGTRSFEAVGILGPPLKIHNSTAEWGPAACATALQWFFRPSRGGARIRLKVDEIGMESH